MVEGFTDHANRQTGKIMYIVANSAFGRKTQIPLSAFIPTPEYQKQSLPKLTKDNIWRLF